MLVYVNVSGSRRLTSGVDLASQASLRKIKDLIFEAFF
jgi:hypothetical protein